MDGMFNQLKYAKQIFSQTIKTVSKLKDTMSVSLGLDVSYGPFSFTANTEYNQMTSSMNTSDKIYISVR